MESKVEAPTVLETYLVFQLDSMTSNHYNYMKNGSSTDPLIPSSASKPGQDGLIFSIPVRLGTGNRPPFLPGSFRLR